MKTYTKTVEETSPRLVIQYDDSPESPREWSNLGLFFTTGHRHASPDGTEHELYQLMMQTSEEADDTDDHIKRMYEADKSIKYIVPVYKYEHGDVTYRRGTAQGFDISNCGFYIVTKETAKELGTNTKDIDSMNRVIDSELQAYTSWANGEVYGYTLYDEQGEFEDSCWGFYDVEDIRSNLPDEWRNEDLNQYIKY